MKIKIGKYIDYTNLDTHFSWLEKVIGEKKYNKLFDFFNPIYNKLNSFKKRKVSIKLDPYDTWSLDSTLAMIIVPALIQLKETTHGSCMVEDNDVPKGIKSTDDENKTTYDDCFIHDRWNYALDEMIYAFTEIIEDCTDDYYSKEPLDGWSQETYTLFEGDRKLWVDKNGLELRNKKISNGTRLFGKYYRGLWD